MAKIQMLFIMMSEINKEAVPKGDRHTICTKFMKFFRYVDWSGRRSTPAGVRGRGDLARLPGPPLERKSTDKV
jgi:hypothetical protein